MGIPKIPKGVKQAAKKAWSVTKKVAKYAAGCYISTGGARFDCLGEMHDLVNQSADEQKEDNVKSSWAPWPCPKKGPWPAPPLCGEGGVELQDLVNQSADVQKEDNVKLQGWHPFKKAAAWAKKFGKKVVKGKACIDVGVKVGIPVGGKLCFR